MATPYRFKRSAVAGKRPTLTDLELGEIALNTYDGKLYAERNTGCLLYTSDAADDC